MIFKDRHEAGERLAVTLKRFKRESTVVFAIPPGGVVAASIVAGALHAPLNLVVLRRVSDPNQAQLLAAVVSENGQHVLNPAVPQSDQKGWLGLALRVQEDEARRLRKIYGPDTATVRGRTAILIDDGMVTGLTMALAIQEVRKLEPQRLIVAVPAATAKAIEKVQPLADATATIVELADGVQGLAGAYARFRNVSDHFVTKTMRSFRMEAERSAS